MKSALTIAFALSALAACSSSPAASSPPSIYQNWLYTSANGGSGTGLTLKSDNTFEVSSLSLTSSSSANAEVQTGTVSISSTSITFTTAEWSCPNGTSTPYVYDYVLNGDSLSLTTPSSVIVMSIDSAPASTNFSLAIGCFSSTGTFTPEPLAPVQ